MVVIVSGDVGPHLAYDGQGSVNGGSLRLVQPLAQIPAEHDQTRRQVEDGEEERGPTPGEHEHQDFPEHWSDSLKLVRQKSPSLLSPGNDICFNLLEPSDNFIVSSKALYCSDELRRGFSQINVGGFPVD